MLQAHNSKGKIGFEVVDPESGDADLWAIKKVGQSIRERMGKINAAEQWIAIGRDLAQLRDKLVKSTGGDRTHGPRPGDNERIGWLKAFELGFIPVQPAQAGKLIAIYRFFPGDATGGHGKDLPTSIKSLYFLVTKFKDRNYVNKLIDEKKITAASSENDLRKLAHDLGLIAKKVKVGIDADSPKGSRVNHVLKMMQKLRLNINDLRRS
jgi:hypothetical protein